jgi:glucose/mannose transport system substrate-binding protein
LFAIETNTGSVVCLKAGVGPVGWEDYMRLSFRMMAFTAALSASVSSHAFAAESVEVLHWWTSGGEAAAVGVLKDDLQKKGVSWQDMPVAGGGGEAATTTLKARVAAGNPPTAAQLLGMAVNECSGADQAVRRP